MKIKALNWLNLSLAFILLFVAILNFEDGNIYTGIFDLFAAGINIYAFLLAAVNWWNTSTKVYKKFVFTCPKCEHQFIPTFWTWIFVPHIGSRRYMKCEKCHKISWMRRK